tara:strand:- start:7463 stop:7627 length:165 start_codon:yes stop_codon:yes gene_type:complete
MNKIVKILMERDNYSKEMAINEVDQMKNLVLRGHNPEDLLYEIGLEPDYIFELI